MHLSAGRGRVQLSDNAHLASIWHAQIFGVGGQVQLITLVYPSLTQKPNP